MQGASARRPGLRRGRRPAALAFGVLLRLGFCVLLPRLRGLLGDLRVVVDRLLEGRGDALILRAPRGVLRRFGHDADVVLAIVQLLGQRLFADLQHLRNLDLMRAEQPDVRRVLEEPLVHLRGDVGLVAVGRHRQRELRDDLVDIRLLGAQPPPRARRKVDELVLHIREINHQWARVFGAVYRCHELASRLIAKSRGRSRSAPSQAACCLEELER